MESERSSASVLLNGLSKLKWNLLVKGLLVGAVSGILAVLYRIAIEYGTKTSLGIYAYLRAHPTYIALWIFVVLAGGLFVAWLVALEPMASGSGIPQVEGVVLFGLKMKWHMILVVRFLGGILCSFFGLSLGREGPSVQIGAAGGQAVSRLLAEHDAEENYLITSGAAAGLSAAFSAPLSGVMFALEEIHRSFSPLILVSAFAASIVADFISKYFFGLRPVLHFYPIPQLPVSYYWYLLPVGIIAGLVGALMNATLLSFQQFYKGIPRRIRPCVAMLIAIPCGLFLPLTLGGGSDLIALAEGAKGGVVVLIIYLVVKLLFTSVSFGSGVPGGIFMPILTVGALSGSILSLTATRFGFPIEYVPVFAICAMAGTLASSVKAPITAILLTAEMSGSLVHTLPVAACAFIGLLVSDILKIDPIYETLLQRFIDRNGTTMTANRRGGIVEVPVEFGCEVVGKAIRDVQWPQGILIVAIRRGAKELVPQGSTVIVPGDYLIALCPQGREHEAKEAMRKLCLVQKEN